MCHSSLSSHGPFISPAPFNVRPVSALHDLFPRLRFSAGPGDALYRATRCGVIFFIAAYFTKVNFFIDFDFYFCKISSWTTGKAGNTAPRGQVPTPSPPDIPPERQGGPEQSGCGCRRGPTASANEAHKGGYPDGGKDRRQAAQRDGGRIKQGDERCGRGWVFSEARNKTGISDFTPAWNHPGWK